MVGLPIGSVTSGMTQTDPNRMHVGNPAILRVSQLVGTPRSNSSDVAPGGGMESVSVAECEVARQVRLRGERLRRLRGAGDGGPQQHCPTEGGGQREEGDGPGGSKRKRAWSAWNVFVSEATDDAHQSGSRDFTQLGRAYKGLDEDTLQRLRQTADEYNRMGVPRGMANSARKRRCLERDRMVRDVAADLGLSSGTGRRPGPGALADIARTATITASSSEVAQRSDAIDALNTVPWEFIERAKVAEQLIKKEARAAKQACELCCQNFCADEKRGQAVLRDVARISNPGHLEQSLPMPDIGPNIRRVEWVAPGLEEKAQKLVAMEAKPYGVRLLYGALDTAWQNYNVTVEPQEWSEEPPALGSKCFKSGVCVCKGLGKHRGQMNQVGKQAHIATLHSRPGAFF